MQISFNLGLRALEISLLGITEVAELISAGTSFKLLEVMALPAGYTNGADAMKRSKSHCNRETISFDIATFNNVVKQIEALATSGSKINPENFYSPVKQHKGKSRDLSMVDQCLRDALKHYILIRLDKGEKLKPAPPLFIIQKGVPQYASAAYGVMWTTITNNQCNSLTEEIGKNCPKIRWPSQHKQ
ncbi:MAG: hypothetical protein OIF51_09795 [Cellvibrionaceae bacterium]|nr:hypothetical protein [Cellvibrionaceae bacterium]